jgi:DNA-binding NtrC family response regulator
MHEGQLSSIYVVDDEEIIAHSLGLILEREGFDVSCFTNPLRALDSIDRKAPDLLISDVIMPQLSGIELAIQTSKRNPDCRILLFSASAAEAMHQAAESGYDFRLLQKPVHPTTLLQEIERIAAVPAI